jgi:hypothetical protein
MAKPLKFVLPKNEAQQELNWKVLIDATQANEFDPFYGTTPAAQGFTNVGNYWGYYTLFGPIVYFTITLLNDGGGSVRWSAGDYMLLPYSCATRGTAHILESHKCFPATERNHAGIVQDWFYLGPGYITSSAGHTSGSSDDSNISGWYFRE